jgi:hypothetical protein
MLIEDLKNAKAINTLNAKQSRSLLLACTMTRKKAARMKGAWSDMWKNTFSGPYCTHFMVAKQQR